MSALQLPLQPGPLTADDWDSGSLLLVLEVKLPLKV
jgi:hypothetical protein